MRLKSTRKGRKSKRRRFTERRTIKCSRKRA